MNRDIKILKWIFSRVIIWRILLLAVAMYAIQAIPFKPSFPYWETLLEPFGNPLFWSWGNFDGVHYITIAQQGYAAQFTQAFFPLYPLLMRYTAKITGGPLSAGLVVSHCFLLIALWLFYKLIRIDRGKSTAKKILLYLLLFPTSYYFGAVYTESLFFALVIGTFYAARRRRWWIAGILGALASSTRIFGIFLLPALLVEWYYGRGKKSVYTPSQLITAVFPILLSASGLIAYMYYLNRVFSDSLMFLHAQPAFGAQRSADKIILLYQVFWRYGKMLLTVDPNNLIYYTISLEAASGLLFLVLSIIAFKKIRPSYAIFAALSYIAPTLTGTLSSMPRYALLLFPSFMVLGLVKNRQFQRVWWVVSAILLAANTALFVRGYWVA